MAAVLSPPSSPAHQQSPHGIATFSSMAGPDQISKTQPSPAEDAESTSPSSVDTIPATSNPFQPLHKSILEYTLVRDFAYDPTDVLHYGSVARTRTSDDEDDNEDDDEGSANSLGFSWEQLKSQFGKGSSKANEKRLDFVPLTLRDGPPYAIDPDLQSPVVKSIRRKKYFSGPAGVADDKATTEGNRANGDGRHNGGDSANLLRPGDIDSRRDSHFAGGKILRHSPEMLDPESYDASSDANDEEEYDEVNDDESEYSRDYQFSITSPDEEMHGKAVALFDFARENENELPLVEGQVIWVSYRHGQGWLVAEDPKTRESGLVPEAYVRLLREIQGGWHSLNNLPGGSENASPLDPSNPHPVDFGTLSNGSKAAQESQSPPHQQNTPQQPPRTQSIPMGKSPSQQSNGSRGGGKSHAPPVVSTFSTSSKDLDPYPSHLLAEEKEGQTTPPKVEHYHGQGGTVSGPPALSPVAMTKSGEEDKNKR